MANKRASAIANYARESARPLVSLVFVTPMLLAYEGATLAFGTQAMRNGADVWLRELLKFVGFGQHFLLPLLTTGMLLGWHHVKGYAWRFRPGVLLGMLVESLSFAVLLMLLARLQSGLLSFSMETNVAPVKASRVAQMFAYFGAGIYEELLFRLMLLPLIICIARGCKVGDRASVVWGVVISSLVFSAAHYQAFTGYGDELQFFTFSFRALAGAFFAVLFLKRGFGVAVGCHALYDMMVVLF